MIPLYSFLPLGPTMDVAGDGLTQIFCSLKNRLSKAKQTGTNCDELEIFHLKNVLRNSTNLVINMMGSLYHTWSLLCQSSTKISDDITHIPRDVSQCVKQTNHEGTPTYWCRGAVRDVVLLDIRIVRRSDVFKSLFKLIEECVDIPSEICQGIEEVEQERPRDVPGGVIVHLNVGQIYGKATDH